MSRALAWQHCKSDGSWWTIGVFLATPMRLDGKVLPGDLRRETWFQTIIDDAQRPALEPYSPARGTWEDWIDWALRALSNGHDSMAYEVEPEATADMLYQREVQGIKPKPMTVQGTATDTLPSGLGGTKADKLRPTGPGGRA